MKLFNCLGILDFTIKFSIYLKECNNLNTLFRIQDYIFEKTNLVQNVFFLKF